MLKCIGCCELRREELNVGTRVEVVYKCPKYFPYMTTIGGLLRPASGITKAAECCPEDPLGHCVLCPNTKITHYGDDIVAICKEHDQAWSQWLDEHPERRAHLSPKGRAIRANWVEVFREFIEDTRLVELDEESRGVFR